jgi:hypothetical protein
MSETPQTYTAAHGIKTAHDADTLVERSLNSGSSSKFKIGDLVTRSGTDVQRVVDINEAGDLIEVECVKPPLGFRQEDGSRGRALVSHRRSRVEPAPPV